MIRKIDNRLRSYVRNTALLVRHFLRREASGIEKPEVHFDVSDPRLERYFYCLVKFFDIAGYAVSIRFRPWLLLHLRNYADLLYNISSLRIAFTRPDSAVVTLTDRMDLAMKGEVLTIDPNYLTASKADSGFVFPYSMHPLVYDKGIDDSVTGLRNGDRTVRLFSYFASLHRYEKNGMAELFGKMNRKEVGEKTLEMSGQVPIQLIRTPDDLEKIRFGRMEFAVVDNVRIPFEEWLPTLARADFFIAAPGVLMPFCHNLIEAMAVGTIPVTEYPEMWSPPLVDGVNCLAYSGSTELKRKIREALEMDDDQIAEMRRAVVEYYDTWFDPKASVARLMAQLDDTDRVYLLAGHLSVSEFENSRRVSK